MDNRQTNSDYILTMAHLWERRLSNVQFLEPEQRTDEAKIEGQQD